MQILFDLIMTEPYIAMTISHLVGTTPELPLVGITIYQDCHLSELPDKKKPEP